MAYTSSTIIEVMKGINHSHYLPSIQRKFVWSCEQIEKLFDSIMSNYPIGTFLFWAIERGTDPSHIDQYTFYKFINNFSEKDSALFNQEKLDKPSMLEHLVAVLDGQQRLSSLYCAIKGSYAKKVGKKISPDNPYPSMELYINLMYVPTNEMDCNYEFKFILPSKAQIIDRNNYWLKVKDVISWASHPDGKATVKQRIKEISRRIKELKYEDITDEDIDKIEITIETLWDKLVVEKLITYYEIKKESLDDVLDIFVRVNSGGTPLSKSDLVFSTIVANWENGREKIEDLIESLNDKGEGFNFNKDFIITLCLALMDLKLKFEVRTFTKENVEKVEHNWGRIVASISACVDLLVEFGFNGENLTATYIIIPVAYYLYKRNIRLMSLSTTDKNNIRKFLIFGMVKKIFSGGVNEVLGQLLNAFRQYNVEKKDYELKVKNRFDFDSIKMLSFQDRVLNVEQTDIEEFLTYKKGPLTFMILSLLYPNIKFKDVKWHQDHLHPKTMFEKAKLKKYFKSMGEDISDEKCREWKAMAETICNLQLLTGQKNQEKGKMSLVSWVNNTYPSEYERNIYFGENYIDANASLELKDFEDFYNKRKEAISKKLLEILNIKIDEDDIEVDSLSENDEYTIIQAAAKVLENYPDGLTLDVIYNEIVNNHLYEFKAKNPENILKIQIRRACEGVKISKERLVKIFRIVKEIDGEVYYGLISKN